MAGVYRRFVRLVSARRRVGATDPNHAAAPSRGRDASRFVSARVLIARAVGNAQLGVRDLREQRIELGTHIARIEGEAQRARPQDPQTQPCGCGEGDERHGRIGHRGA
jgi:hypothetical protein